MGNHPELSYQGGQQPMIHLQSDLEAVIEWAETNRVHWAFSDRNAGAYLTDFYNDPSAFSKINWLAIESRDFRSPDIKDGKQAEFLLFGSFPWTLIEKIGTINSTISTRVQQVLETTAHQPVIAVKPNWYY